MMIVVNEATYILQMWACAQGHTEAAVVLYNWNKGPLHSFNREGNLPLLVARQHGHHKLADQLEQIDSSPDMSHDQDSSRSHESISSTNIYPTHSLENAQSMGKMCSNLDSVSQIRSTPEKTYFSTDFPMATSTPITKYIPGSSDSLTTNQETSDSENVLRALHIDIPTSDRDIDGKSHKQLKRENQPYSSQAQMLETLPVSKTVSMTSSSTPLSKATSMTSSSTPSLSMSERRQKLRKRCSVDIISTQTLEPVQFSHTAAFERPVRESNSEPQLAANMEHLLYQTNPMLSDGRELGKICLY